MAAIPLRTQQVCRARFRAKGRDCCEQVDRDPNSSIWSRRAERLGRGGIAPERDMTASSPPPF